jgi:hypothetical protein
MSRVDAERITAVAPDDVALRRDPKLQMVRDAVRRRARPDSRDGKRAMPLTMDRSLPCPARIGTVATIDLSPEMRDQLRRVGRPSGHDLSWVLVRSVEFCFQHEQPVFSSKVPHYTSFYIKRASICSVCARLFTLGGTLHNHTRKLLLFASIHHVTPQVAALDAEDGA